MEGVNKEEEYFDRYHIRYVMDVSEEAPKAMHDKGRRLRRLLRAKYAGARVEKATVKGRTIVFPALTPSDQATDSPVFLRIARAIVLQSVQSLMYFQFREE